MKIERMFFARRTFQYRDNHQNRLAQPHMELVNCSQGYPLVTGKKSAERNEHSNLITKSAIFQIQSYYVMYSALERYLSLKIPSLFR